LTMNARPNKNIVRSPAYRREKKKEVNLITSDYNRERGKDKLLSYM